jgi:class 3 adenylate cyclase
LPYDPKPIDNSDIELDKQLEPLIERLAENNHDLWAKGRVAEGWKLGPRRDDEKRETPFLVPYTELPGSEKQYDRKMAVETLKSIVHFGGHVEPPRTTHGSPDDALESWAPGRVPPGSYEEYRDLGGRANEKGQSLLAYDIASEGLGFWKGDPALLQINALALARMGSAEQARNLLSPLAGADDEETAGIAARIYKDLWLRTGDAADLRQARDNYLNAYQSRPDRYWTGINAATLSWALGEAEKAVDLARRISADCATRLSAPGKEEYWLRATLAEADLILAASANTPESDRRWRTVENLYGQARTVAANNFGNVFSTWRNARIVLQQLPVVIGERLENAFQVPRVAVFAGHRIDAAGRTPWRFPPDIADKVKQAIKDDLRRLNVGVGFATAASGSDILFLEAISELGGKIHIVTPCDEEQFIAESVAESGDEWVARYRSVMKKAEEIIVASEEKVVMGGLSFQYAADLLDGLATMRARQFETDPHHIAVWNELPGDGPGGTYDAVQRWRSRGVDVHVINPVEIAGGASHAAAPDAASGQADPESRQASAGIDAEVRAMIFADVKHFSKLTEGQVPVFLRGFIRPLAQVVGRLNPAPEFQNTWGDGFFFVFKTVGDAGRFALKLRDAVKGIDRAAIGLPEDMDLRIAIHAGPVFRFMDQIIGKHNFIGSHVNRAARIEPVTVPGRIYATEAFAALATLQVPGQFRFDYVGKVPLAKDFGRFALYDMNLD